LIIILLIVFLSFCIIDFFLISPFNIWLVENWGLLFFQIRCFWSNNPDREFEKLTRVDIMFFLCIFFLAFIFWQCFIFKEKWALLFSLFILYKVFSISCPGPWFWWVNPDWLNPYYSGYKFIMLTRVDLGLFLSYFTQCFPSIFNWLRIKLCCLSSFEKKYFCQVCYFFLIWSICYRCLYYYHIIKIKTIYFTRSDLWPESWMFLPTLKCVCST